MLNQKDNDFDDLFRRASDKYPLRTDSADWDRMNAALDNPPYDIPEEVVDVDRRRKRRFLWLFLLFPLVGGGYYFAQRGGAHTKATVGQQQEVVAKTGVEEKGATAGTGVETKNSKNIPAAGAEENRSTADAGVTGGTGVSGGAGVTGAAGGSDVKGGARLGENGKMAGGTGNGLSAKGRSAKKGRGAKGGNGVNGVSSVNEVGGAENFDAATLKLKNENNNIKSNNSNSVNGFGGSVNGFDGSAAGRVANYPVNRARINGDYRLTVNVQAPVVAIDSSKTTAKASSKKKSSYLYAGLIAAPDFSTVKFQKMNGVGTTFGVLLGYQFNKRWAVESGIYLDRKRYYTDAEYFDPKALKNVPQNWTVKNFDGTCYMWEIPINVRYNFSLNEKNRWFGTAGVSTYLMTSEKYNYNYDAVNWGVVSGPYSKPWDPKTPSQYWFSIINLSIGYEHRLGGIGNLRIEPYLRIPVAGLGTGKLNILSSGINIGITRRLW